MLTNWPYLLDVTTLLDCLHITFRFPWFDYCMSANYNIVTWFNTMFLYVNKLFFPIAFRLTIRVHTLCEQMDCVNVIVTCSYHNVWLLHVYKMTVIYNMSTIVGYFYMKKVMTSIYMYTWLSTNFIFYISRTRVNWRLALNLLTAKEQGHKGAEVHYL